MLSDKWRIDYQDGDTDIVLDGGVPGINQWTHIAMTWNRNGNLTLYVDGVQVNTTNISGQSFLSTQATVKQIGRVGDATSTRHWSGVIDEVLVFNRALSPQEINASYNSKLYRLERNFTNLGVGDYQYYASATDSFGKTNSTETRIVYIRNTTVVITDGANKTISTKGSQSINITSTFRHIV